MRSLRRWSLVALFASLASWGTAQEAPKADLSRLTLDRIFTAKEFELEKAPAVRWYKQGYLKQESSPRGQQLVFHDPAVGTSEVLVPAHWLIPAGESRPLALEGYELSDDGSKLLISTNSKRVWRTNSRGDFWVLDLGTRELRKLGGGGDIPASSMMFATLSPNARHVAYVHDNNLYVQDLRDFQVKQLTSDGSSTKINGTFDWVYEEELSLQRGFRWKPDSSALAYWQLDCERVKEFHITNSGDGPYTRLISIRYPKTGEQNSAARIGVVSIQGGPTHWLHIPGDPREHYLAKLGWAGELLAVQQFNRLQNTNTVMLIDPKPLAAPTVPWFTETEKTWVENNNDFRWLQEGKSLLWLSERDGWLHAYAVGRDGKAKLITEDAFDLIHVDAIDTKGGWLYFTASPTNPTQRYLYRVPLQGGKAERMTPAEFAGTNTYSISDDHQWAVHTHSTFNTPPQTTLIHLSDHRPVKVLETNAKLKQKLAMVGIYPSPPTPLPQGERGEKAGVQVVSEFFRVDIGNDVQLDGWCIKPPGFSADKKYPVVFYVYGEPWGQTVLDRWDGRKALWHHLLAQQGYVVMSVDNRGTPAPRGREWRRCIYRQMGILAPADQAAATRALLKQRPYLDPARVAIWGWSGGGSMTLHAILRYPELYQTAIAIAPVPNQRHYDTIYQERYMGLPADNAEGYRKGSPITYASQLKGNLLLIHGTGDDNCHYLGTEALIDELIVHNKPFSMLAYPNRSHSISEGVGTTRHLYESMTRFLRANTPP